MVKKLLVIVLVYFCLATTIMAKLTASVDRKTVRIDETLMLTINSDKPLTRRPDLNTLSQALQPLSQTNFSQTSYKNGRRVTESGWKIQLLALEEGIITIPSFTLENESTLPIQITVLTANQSSVKGGIAPLFTKIKLSEVNPFVQQQVILTVIVSSNSDIDNAQLLPPQLNNALVRSLGEPTEFVSRIAGELYRIFEYKFSIFPQAVGLIEIPPMVFQGNKIVRFQSRNPLSLLSSQSRRVRIRTDKIVLDVKAAIPSSATWLPASNLEIESSWRPAPEGLSVGEPITRILTIAAEGLDATQLPEFTMPEIDGISWFPNPAERENNFDGIQINSKSTQRFALMPNKKGNYQLPAVEVKWFDVVDNKFKIATIKAQQIQVDAAIIEDNPLANPLQNLTLGLTGNSSQELAILDSEAVNFWKNTALTSIFLWVLTIIGGLFYRHKKIIEKSNPKTNHDKAPASSSQTLPASKWKGLAKQIHGLSSASAYKLIKLKSESNYDSFDEFVDAIEISGQQLLAEFLRELSKAAFSANPHQAFDTSLIKLLATLPDEIEHLNTQPTKHKISPLYD